MLCHTRSFLLVGSVVMWTLTSCSREAPPLGNATVEAKRDSVEATFAEQAEAIRAGTGDTIRLDETVVTDRDIADLDGVDDKLRRVNLSHTELSDASLARLAKCAQLEQLRVASPSFTDQGVAVLTELPRLKYLHLINSPLTDGAVPHLKRLTGLSALYLDGTEISLASMRELRDALPDTHIHFDGGHYRGDPGADSHEK
jgi:hypothetical protein